MEAVPLAGNQHLFDRVRWEVALRCEREAPSDAVERTTIQIPIGLHRSHSACAQACYCLVKTNLLLTVCPCAFVPVWVTVRVFPSRDTTRRVAKVILPFTLLTFSKA